MTLLDRARLAVVRWRFHLERWWLHVRLARECWQMLRGGGRVELVAVRGERVTLLSTPLPRFRVYRDAVCVYEGEDGAKARRAYEGCHVPQLWTHAELLERREGRYVVRGSWKRSVSHPELEAD